MLLSNYVEYLTTKGVKVYFFEMPIHPVLVELPTATIIRNDIFRLFPTGKVTHILRDSTLYETGDGVHLNKLEAIRYTSYFKSQIKEQL